eukprot:TRINITY_DN19373_c0_g1::TRINITY_DN19373_c0_g1_i1::g.7879::m.7879 TRINITY_DN19373_c0_g1::TRINITY_DN19373_c0_g1_i1::g.7879  ORF type:complete len:782 (+),score=239.91,sp/Q7ZWR2/SYCC_XENLA/42.30/0.0,tRNA-synt_1e/PF01406.14/9.9e+02,tRNA-synt_1e/PF01406.14/9e-120,tRNA-synt_1e/PF01406.14/2.8e+02,tRNA-synt_1g/PF09334.6/0.00038,tRNA-synt_1g/PF09334.6/0.054,DALR_2/PF09190.6/1.1e+04,DALR_2/PF09190.6/0.0022,Glyco_hydro_66/PF13199.1/0.0056,Corona_S2/PF01601.11/0.26 TRINITY_DN19373_c0_g1_i1:3-2348(+)
MGMFRRTFIAFWKMAATNYPSWQAPKSNDPTLKVFNSLTHGLADFVPKVPRQIKGYICGPTVYDSSHLGHARAYVSFDIIRRILEDYFGYDVFWVMNITDIDDKIILKARRNYLFKQYEQEKAQANIDEIWKEVTLAFEQIIPRQEEHLKRLAAEDKPDEDQVKQETFKLEMLRKSKEAATAAHSAGNTADLLKASKDVLADWLDGLKGSEIRDQSIFRDHAAYYEAEYMADMEALGVKPPSAMTRVSEYIPQVVSFIESIIDKKYAYESNGSVYFDTINFKKVHHYGKLMPGAVGNASLLEEGEGALSAGCGSEKRCRNDFALWKKAKPGEPEWDSPWGKGRPGWHIECSAMAGDLLGENFDIHCGGEDLRFPHHENELAQSEACFDNHQWVNYFLHCGHLHIDGCKMSKSLKNFVTIREMLDPNNPRACSPRLLRMLFLNTPWNRRVNFSRDSLEEVRKKEKSLNEFFLNVKVLLRTNNAGAGGFVGGSRTLHVWTDEEKALRTALETAQANFRMHLCNNFDTPAALNELLELLKTANKVLVNTPTEQGAASGARIMVLFQIAEFLTKMLRMFGVIQSSDAIGFPDATTSEGVDKQALVAPFVDAYCDMRDRVRDWSKRAKKQEKTPDQKLADVMELMKLCDEGRDVTMANLGVRVEDGSTAKSSWKLVTVEEIKAERRQKLETSLKDRQKDLDLWQSYAKSPADVFKTPEFDGFKVDEKGIPTHSKDGKEVNKKLRKVYEKQFETQVKNHTKFADQGEKTIANLTAEIERLTGEIKAL